MEKRLIEEMITMKGGLGRLEKVLEDYRQERADCLIRVRRCDELIDLIVRSLAEKRAGGKEVVDIGGQQS